MAVGLDVLAEGAGVCVALQAAHHLTVIGLVHVVRARVLETVAGVGVTLVATLVWTNVGLFTCSEEERLVLTLTYTTGPIKRLVMSSRNTKS